MVYGYIEVVLVDVMAVHTLEDTDGRRKVVDTPGCADSSGDDGGGGDEIIGEAVVQVSLHANQRTVSFCQTAPFLMRDEMENAKDVWVYWVSYTYLKLENIVDLVKLLLVPGF